MTIEPYIVLLPHSRGNTTDQHLVVHVQEWVTVSLNEKDSYDFLSECDDYAAASEERDRLNRQAEEENAWPDEKATSPAATVRPRPAWSAKDSSEPQSSPA